MGRQMKGGCTELATTKQEEKRAFPIIEAKKKGTAEEKRFLTFLISRQHSQKTFIFITILHILS